MLTPREKSSFRQLQGGWNPQCYMMQDSKPNTLPTELFWPHDGFDKWGCGEKTKLKGFDSPDSSDEWGCHKSTKLQWCDSFDGTDI